MTSDLILYLNSAAAEEVGGGHGLALVAAAEAVAYGGTLGSCLGQIEGDYLAVTISL